MAEWVIFTVILVVSIVIGFGEILIDMVDEAIYWLRNRRPRKAAKGLEDWDDQNRPKKLNYNYIDWLERDLKVGKYDPDRIALGFDDTRPKPEPLDPEIDELPMETPGQFSAEESAALVDRLLGDLNELNAKIGAKPVDDSWADVDVWDGSRERGGLLRRIVDSHGNWTEIRSFGS